MADPVLDRIFGVETEFGCLVVDSSLGSPDIVVDCIKDVVFRDLKLGALDLHSRDDVFEPAECGGFLVNGSRLYVDAVGSHLEYATAECCSLKDLIANDRAGQRHIISALRELEIADAVSVYNNSVDHFGGHTFGCHENYLVTADDGFLAQSLSVLLSFLVTRQIFAGVGRVGGHILSESEGGPTYSEVAENPIDYIWVSQIYGVAPDPSVNFQLSQRADHILKTVASRVRFNRAIINPKWEHFYSHAGKTRLHLLFGEANQNEYAYALKVGTTSMVLSLIEAGLAPNVTLKRPLLALRQVSRDPSYRWIVELEGGSTMSSIDLQRLYLEAAANLKGVSPGGDWVLREWEATLDGLERDPLSMGDSIDWVAKRHIVERYMSQEGLDWTDPALHSVDLEYHNIDPAQSLFHGWAQTNGVRQIVDEVDIVDAMTEAPSDTRAYGRSQRVKQVVARSRPGFYLFDWNGVALSRNEYTEMPDPFCTYDETEASEA